MRKLLVCAIAFLLVVGGSVIASGQAGDVNSELIMAAKVGSQEKVKECLAKGANVNATEKDSGVTPLICAVLNGNIDVVKMLLEKGANVNAKSTGGVTALMAASLDQSKVDIAKLLIDKGAEVNAKTKVGVTPLKYSEFSDAAQAEAAQKISSLGLQPKGVTTQAPSSNAMSELLKKHGAQ